MSGPAVQAVPTRADIEAAAERTEPYVRRTPVLPLEVGALGLAFPVTLKLELLQVTGSFKPRGAFNRLLAAEQVPAPGVIAASGGNFGLAAAYAARVLGHRAEIYVPSASPQAKIDKIRDQVADVRVVDGLYDDAAEAVGTRAAETGALLMHPYDQPEVVAAHGVVGLEIADQVPDADTVLVAVGGGGLIGGIATWFGGRSSVISVEPEGSRCLDAAREASEPVDVVVDSLASDSLGARRLGNISWSVVEAGYVTRSVLVSDDDIRGAQRALFEELRLVVEPGGAAALAALRSGAYRPLDGERVVALVCGSNADWSTVV